MRVVPGDAPVLEEDRLGRFVPDAGPRRDGVRERPLIRDVDDVKFLFRAAGKLFGHLLNKSRGKNCGCK